MKPPPDHGDHDFQWQRCQCGWVSSNQQLAVWPRQNQLVSRICPHCGTPSPLHNKILYQGQQSRLVH